MTEIKTQQFGGGQVDGDLQTDPEAAAEVSLVWIREWITPSVVTLQWVEDGEEVHEGQVDGSPGEQSEAPRHTQQEGEADDAPQVSQNLDHNRRLHLL